jgi:hypothetical protein
VWAAPYVACGEQGAVEVVSGGVRHRIAVKVNRLTEQPDIQHETAPDPFVKSGTIIRLHWPGIASASRSPTALIFTKVPGS